MKLFDVYSLQPVQLTKAFGSKLWDNNNTEYLDMYGGHAVISVGHNHPHYNNALQHQLQHISFYSNSVIIPQQQQLASLLGEVSGYNNYQLFLCNSGAEANENALKVASFHTGKSKFIVLKNAFHGRTSAAVAATDDASIIAPVNKTNNFIFIYIDDESALINAFKQNEIAGVLVEGIQGVAGIYECSTAFLNQIQNYCKQYNALFILDEVQSGYGRTGKFFAHQHHQIQPDIITIAKGMGNGFPIGGVCIAPHIPAKLKMLGTTFGGNHLACAAAIAVLQIIKSEALISNANEIGNYLISQLKKIQGITEVRGRGLMIGVQTPFLAKDINNALLKNYQIFMGSANEPNTIRILPALNVTKQTVDYFVDALQKTLQTFKNNSIVN